MNVQVRRAAADVVAAWLADGTSPRDAMASSPSLRPLPSRERAAIARLAAETIGARRRLEFLLAGPRGLVAMPPFARALALVLAQAVLSDQLSAAGARRELAAHGVDVDLTPLLAAASLLAGDATTPATLVFARRHSLPDWFAERALSQFGDEAEAVVAALAEPAPRTLRANLLRVAGRDELAGELAAAGIATAPARFAVTALHALGDADLFATAAWQRGAFEQQDEASQLVAAITAPPPGGKVLDLCAGNGGKALALAAAMRNRGVVMASDVHEGRLRGLRERARRAGATNLQVHELPDGAWPEPVRTFAGHADRILVDAPCSGTGSWRRRPEARWSFDETSLATLAATQQQLLLAAADALRPGARLVYATCSLLAAENEQQIAALRAARPALEPVRLAEILGGAAAAPITDATGTCLSLRPDRHGCDGFFAAVLRRPRA